MHITSAYLIPVIIFHILSSSNTILSLNNYAESNLGIATSPSFFSGAVIFIHKNHTLVDWVTCNGEYSVSINLCNQIHKYGFNATYIISPAIITDTCEYSLPTNDIRYSEDVKIYDEFMIGILITLGLILLVFF